jgi:hypothetical protein
MEDIESAVADAQCNDEDLGEMRSAVDTIDLSQSLIRRELGFLASYTAALHQGGEPRVHELDALLRAEGVRQ